LKDRFKMIQSRRSFLRNAGLVAGVGSFSSLYSNSGEEPRNIRRSTTKPALEYTCDILIVGGSFGGVSAALAAAQMGKRVIITEETLWIGGQATTQGVPLDEHPWIEQYGRNQSYANYREAIRNYYRDYYPLSYAARKDPHLNPGAAWVTALGYEPRVGLAVLDQMLAPHYTSGRIRILTCHKPVVAEMDGDYCRAVVFEDLLRGGRRSIDAPYILDATELGDLLELGGIEHVIGAESQNDTGEPNAYAGSADPLRQQPFTHLIAVDHLPGENHIIDKPKDYEKFRSGFSQLRMRRLFAPENPNKYESCIWNFRRSFFQGNFEPGAFPSDITMIMNGNEYEEGPLVGVSEKEAASHLEQARQLSLSVIYFFQTEITPGYRGKPGYPGIRPRGDVFGTLDGLAQHPYIRESRRIQGEFTVLEQHFLIKEHPNGPRKYHDSVGVGGYRIDIHEKRKKTSFTQELHSAHWPQQIPLGCMIPVRVDNVIPACKNVGTTHITNGAFRLHPVEWAIGEAAGTLAAYCSEYQITPRSVRNSEKHLHQYREQLKKQGVEMNWPKMEFARSYNSHYVEVPDWYWGRADLKYD